MSDYYEPYPRILLERPILIAGQIGCGARLIARTLCARTGLPFIDVDRKIEHEAGASLAQIARDQGSGRIARWARTIVERHAQQRPWSAIVLDHAWPTIEVAQLLRRNLDFVHIQRSNDFLLGRIRREIQHAGRWMSEGFPETVVDAADLEPYLDRRRPLLSEARILLDAGSQHELAVARIVQESLDPVAREHAI